MSDHAEMRARAERTLDKYAGIKAPWNELQLARDVIALTDQLDARGSHFLAKRAADHLVPHDLADGKAGQ